MATVNDKIMNPFKLPDLTDLTQAIKKNKTFPLVDEKYLGLGVWEPIKPSVEADDDIHKRVTALEQKVEELSSLVLEQEKFINKLLGKDDIFG